MRPKGRKKEMLIYRLPVKPRIGDPRLLKRKSPVKSQVLLPAIAGYMIILKEGR